MTLARPSSGPRSPVCTVVGVPARAAGIDPRSAGATGAASIVVAATADSTATAASCASQSPCPQTISTGPPGAAPTASANNRRPCAASTSATPLAANLAVVSAVTMPAPNVVVPQ